MQVAGQVRIESIKEEHPNIREEEHLKPTQLDNKVQLIR